MTTSKKDFIKAAEIVGSSPKFARPEIAEAFLRFFRDDNPRFDKNLFISACGLEPESFT